MDKLYKKKSSKKEEKKRNQKDTISTDNTHRPQHLHEMSLQQSQSMNSLSTEHCNAIIPAHASGSANETTGAQSR